MSAARDKAKGILEQIPNRDIISIAPDHDLFIRYTNTSHESMKANWDKGGIMTACNGWTGTYSTMLGRPGLGVFDLQKASGSAWVQADGSVMPQYGDVFRMKKLHVGVCLECTPTQWTVIEAGQGGKSTGYDILRRSKKSFVAAEVLGWVDIDIYLDPDVMAKDAIRTKLKGTWSVKIDTATRAYTFAGPNEVSYIEKGKKVIGTWSSDDTNVTIKWSNGIAEQWPLPLPGLYTPSEGTWSDGSGKSGVTNYRKAY